MAKYLTLAGLLFAAASPAVAQGLSDPTRPPGFAAAEDAPGAASAASPALQSVLISPQRKEAIISGRTVTVGDKVGDARVVRIGEDEVVLRRGKTLQALKLFPDIEKRPHAGRIPTAVKKQPQ